MFGKRLFTLVGLVVVMGMLFTACQPTAPANPTDAVSGPTDAAQSPTQAPTEAGTPPVVVTEPVAGGEMDVYRVTLLADITSSNIWNLFGPGASAYNYVVQGNYWPYLMVTSDQRFDLVPQLAADFSSPRTQEGEYWVTTIPLKQGVLWSDGAEITADDVVFTLNLCRDFELGGNWDCGSSEFVRAEAVDRYTVKFYYTVKPGLVIHEYGILQDTIAQKAYWEPKVAAAVAALNKVKGLDAASDEYVAGLSEAQNILYGIEAQDEPLFGAYTWTRWEPGAFVENAMNPQHFFKGVVVEQYANGAYREVRDDYEFVAYGEPTGDKTLVLEIGPNAKSVIYTVYNQDAAVLALLNGDVDYVYNPNGYGPGLRAQIQGAQDVEMAINPRNGWRFMGFNFNRAPMNDLAVREAITCMINKEFLTDSILQGAALPVYTPIPEANGFWYNPNAPKLCYGMSERERMEWAVARLKEAGYTWDVEPTWNEARGGSVEFGRGLRMPNGDAIPTLRLIAPSAGYDPLRATTGVMIEQWASMLGFPVKAELTNFNNILNETLGGGDNYDMVISGWGLGNTFPKNLCTFFSARGGPFNFVHYQNAELDAMCDAFYEEDDLMAARELAYRMQELLAKELPYAYLFSTPVYDAYNTNVVYPYTTVLDGIEGYYGLQDRVMAAE